MPTETNPSPTALRTEIVRGSQMISRIKELQEQGMIVLKMKHGPGNGVYEIEWRSDWTNPTEKP